MSFQRFFTGRALIVWLAYSLMLLGLRIGP